jgi:hypothetical protein
MVARTQRLLGGVIFPLVIGVLLLTTAVLVADEAWPGDGAGVIRTGYRCDRQCGPPGQNGNCTYAHDQCTAVGNDLAGNAGGNAFFKTTQYRQWGKCNYTATLGNSADTCTEYATYVCARIWFYPNIDRRNRCIGNAVNGIWITVGPNICTPDPNMAGNMLPCPVAVGEER